ncbi:hypothetical protein AVEN_274738-1 [Araneus ventricosus]|uniref:Uncharacterized protein n=1 Tax=Araneus ventricosus TaxID=182803 RepID=A0A4Y2RPC3_ARAVE|nr:hypothetical protein AVEN_274738-1 [Araneus ventricosus]
MILASKEYEEECAKEWLNTRINGRKEREENELWKEEIAEGKRQEKIAERKRQEEIAEQKHQEEIQMEERRRREEQEYEDRKQKDEMEFELKKSLGAEGRFSNSFANQNANNTQIAGLLPFEVAQLIAREPDEIANDYNEVKKILLKRYKLTP